MTHGKFYCARLDWADCMLFSLMRRQGQIYALMLEATAQQSGATAEVGAQVSSLDDWQKEACKLALPEIA